MQQLVPKLRRGDLSEASFGFRATKQEWNEDKSKRILHAVTTHRGDVSIVVHAANPRASATLRAGDLSLEQRQAVAERMGDRVCGPFSAPDLGSITARRSGDRIVASYLPIAKARRAKLRRTGYTAERATARRAQVWRAHPGSDAHTEGDPPPRTDAEVQKLGEEGLALKRKNAPGFHFPIVGRRDLLAAIKAWGRATPSEKSDVKAWIKLRARILGFESLLPAGWQSKAKHKPGPNEPGGREGPGMAPTASGSVGGQEQA